MAESRTKCYVFVGQPPAVLVAPPDNHQCMAHSVQHTVAGMVQHVRVVEVLNHSTMRSSCTVISIPNKKDFKSIQSAPLLQRCCGLGGPSQYVYGPDLGLEPCPGHNMQCTVAWGCG
jgi:hypothetical protein